MSSRFALYRGITIPRLAAYLPSACGEPGPHAFRLEASLGMTVLCDDAACAICQAEARQDPAEDRVQSFHLPSLVAGS